MVWADSRGLFIFDLPQIDGSKGPQASRDGAAERFSYLETREIHGLYERLHEG